MLVLRLLLLLPLSAAPAVALAAEPGLSHGASIGLDRVTPLQRELSGGHRPLNRPLPAPGSPVWRPRDLPPPPYQPRARPYGEDRPFGGADRRW